ncbi:hypothetical protein AC1031_006019 [Aphanomyces cochlioides]|nr:hypothetical protein AC1031_006019 [Aphanomyces cochlioides]
MPQLPTPPRYDGTTANEKKKFMQLYQEYWFQCASLRQLGFQPYVMPVGACIADVRRSRIAKYDLRKPAEQISEDEWIAYFFQGNELGIVDYGRADRQMKGLRLNTTFTDSTSRVSHLVHSMDIILEKLSMTSMVDDEPKRVVGYLVDALAPPDFKATVIDELGRSVNKSLKSDVLAFVDYLHVAMHSYMRWERERSSSRVQSVSSRHTENRSSPSLEPKPILSRPPSRRVTFAAPATTPAPPSERFHSSRLVQSPGNSHNTGKTRSAKPYPRHSKPQVCNSCG